MTTLQSTSSLFAGTNGLLRLGATPLTRVDDVLELFDLVPTPVTPTPMGDAARELLARLRNEPATADELVRASGVSPGEASAALIELELAGQVNVEDGVYRPAV